MTAPHETPLADAMRRGLVQPDAGILQRHPHNAFAIPISDHWKVRLQTAEAKAKSMGA